MAAPPLGRAAIWCGPLGRPPTSPFRLYIHFLGKTLSTQASIHEKFRCSAATRNPNPETRNSVLTPCRDGELEEIIAIIITDTSPSTIHDSPIHVRVIPPL